MGDTPSFFKVSGPGGRILHLLKTLSFSDLIRESRKTKSLHLDHPVKPDADIGISPLAPTHGGHPFIF